jgi:hypothetical protein
MTIAPCWQYLVKTKIGEQRNNIPPEYDPDDIKILPISWRVANDFIVTYEWVGNMGTSKYCFGLFFGEYLASVVCYGPLVVPSHYSNILGSNFSGTILQLCRGASTYWSPKWTSSKLISYSLKLLKRAQKVNIVVAYANPETGEVGTIYQACNAYYIGETSPGGGKRYIINGHSYDPRKVVKKFGSRSRNHLLTIDPTFKTIAIKPKYRYIFVLGSKKERKEILQRINTLVREYPKRATDIRSTSVVQSITI